MPCRAAETCTFASFRCGLRFLAVASQFTRSTSRQSVAGVFVICVPDNKGDPEGLVWAGVKVSKHLCASESDGLHCPNRVSGPILQARGPGITGGCTRADSTTVEATQANNNLILKVHMEYMHLPKISLNFKTLISFVEKPKSGCTCVNSQLLSLELRTAPGVPAGAYFALDGAARHLLPAGTRAGGMVESRPKLESGRQTIGVKKTLGPPVRPGRLWVPSFLPIFAAANGRRSSDHTGGA